MRILKLVASSVVAVLAALGGLILLLKADARAGMGSVVVLLAAGALAGAATWQLFPPDDPPTPRTPSGEPAAWPASFRRRYRATYVAWVLLVLAGIAVRVIDGGFGKFLAFCSVVLGFPFAFLVLWRCPACGQHLGVLRSRRTCTACATEHSTD